MHGRDQSFAPNPSALGLGGVGGRGVGAAGVALGSGSGALRDVRFLDLDVAQAHMTQQHLLVQGSSTAPPCASGITSLAGQRCADLTTGIQLEQRKNRGGKQRLQAQTMFGHVVDNLDDLVVVLVIHHEISVSDLQKGVKC